MIIIKQKNFYFVGALAIVNLSCAGSEHMGERLGKEIRKGIKEASENVSVAIKDGSPKIVSDAAKTIGEAGKDVSKNLSEGLERGAEKLGSEAAGKISEAAGKLAPVAHAFVAYTVVKDVVYIGKDIYNNAYPDDETKARRRKAQETISEIDAKREFRECLRKNAKNPKGKLGIPASCEECGITFAYTSGEDAYNDMVKIFKKFSME